ncbi:MAG TPA: DUF222 domain-containing protein [Candidatus Eisenbacteria bacterium]|nr:DUF222 domain-containing protein [Candidatus Eisenbacteria bacterium]
MSDLSDETLRRDLPVVVSRERSATSVVLAYIAEYDARKLYLEDGYESMFAFLVGALHFSDDAAYKRIQAARAARRFPEILTAVADGRLHLSGVCLLSPHLTESTAPELLAAATHRSKSQIEHLLAARFPRQDIAARVVPIALPSPLPGEKPPVTMMDPSASTSTELAPGQVDAPMERPKVKPVAPQRYSAQFPMSQKAKDSLDHIQEMLSVPASEIGQIVEDALALYEAQVEKQKFAATSCPSKHPRTTRSARTIPADVQRAVWERDGGQCTFVSDTGHRCEARKFIQFDHIEPAARGGDATVSNIRLLCQAHNHYEAERTYGSEFMRHKRIAAAERRGLLQNHKSP